MAPIATAAQEPFIPAKRKVQLTAATEAVGGSYTRDEREPLVLNTIRCLAADLVQQYNGGHPGTVMGAAAIAVALWRYQMRYNPKNAEWLGRDRFVLSAGHAALLQYILLHFSGYEFWTLDHVKDYHAPLLHAPAAGHPEIEFPGIEVTTGPLGQGIANSVGLAFAGKQMAAQYNREGFPILDSKVWCFSGDGCIQEGVGMESISLAGHWGLDNLILVYDNNNVTVDGSIDATFTDDTSAKLAAQGWHVIDVLDAVNDVEGIVAAFDEARSVRGKPTLVNIRTVIGHGSTKANTGAAHGAALGVDNVAETKKTLGFSPDEKFVVPPAVYDYFASCAPRGAKLEAEWDALFAKYAQAYPAEHAELMRRLAGKMREGWEQDLPPKSALPQGPCPVRQASGIVVKALAPKDKTWVVGSADLMEATHTSWPGQVEFQNPVSGRGNYAGRYVRWGVREHAMAGVANGLAAYQKGTFLPVIATFLMFYMYAAPAARMAALQRLRFIGLASHDSIGLGCDGPTHQPIAVANFFRALPGFTLMRPADAEEVMGAYLTVLADNHINRPAIFALSRQAVPLLPGSDRTKVRRGAYIVHGADIAKPAVTLVSTGSEVSVAVATAEKLTARGVPARVASMPSQAHFDAQPEEYRRSVLPSHESLVVSIEVYVSYGWQKYAHAGAHMTTFGMSAPPEELFEYYGFGPDNLANKIGAFVDKHRNTLPAVGQFVELLQDQVHNEWALEL